MSVVGGYFLRLTAASLLAALVRRMAPAGGPGRAARLGAGLLILLTAFSPLVRLDLLQAVEDLARAGYADVLTTDELSRETNALYADLISREAEAYILDKAEGLSLVVEVETAVQDYYPIPWSVSIRGSPTEEQRAALSRMIAEDLGIPEERQAWWDM